MMYGSDKRDKGTGAGTQMTRACIEDGGRSEVKLIGTCDGGKSK